MPKTQPIIKLQYSFTTQYLCPFAMMVSGYMFINNNNKSKRVYTILNSRNFASNLSRDFFLQNKKCAQRYLEQAVVCILDSNSEIGAHL